MKQIKFGKKAYSVTKFLPFCAVAVFAASATSTALLVRLNGQDDTAGVYREISIEYGQQITLSAFFDEVPENAAFVTDISQIDTSKVGEYTIQISNDQVIEDAVVNVLDLTPPTADPVPQEFYLIDEIPSPETCVENISDISEVHVFYTDGTPTFEFGGEYDIGVSVVDEYGNLTEMTVPFTVKDDHLAPVIWNAKDLTIVMGEPVSYKSGIKVTDDFDEKPSLEVDASRVKSSVAGTYPLTYTATDECGNQSSVTVNVNVIIRSSAGFTDEDDEESVQKAYEMASEVLEQICDEDDTDVEKAMAIYYWVNHNMGFTRHTKTFDSWADAAVSALTVRSCSCYGYWATCKAMLDVCGIDNICVTRPASAGSVHFWSIVYLNGGWYHCDAQAWSGWIHSFVFMMTDEELEKFRPDLVFEGDLYPERATESVQRYVNANGGYVARNFPYVEEDE